MGCKVSKVRMWLEKRSPAQIITGYYLLAVMISILLFSLPQVYKPKVELSFFDKVFMAVSVVTDTGMTIFNISETYSVFGYFIIMLVLQFGGIGIMAMSTFFWLLLGHKIGLKQRRLIMIDNNQFALSGLVRLVRDILKMIIFIELFGGIILGFHFLNYYPDWKEAFLQGLFSSVCATTNAGMDITGESYVPFANDYFVQLITIIQIIIGAIGFPVLIEVKEYLSRKKIKGEYRFRFSLFTKVTTATYGILLVIGTILIFLLEFQHYFKDVPWHKTFFYAFFQSATTRSTGFTTMDITDFSTPTLLVMSILMFIGGSPNSMGGGIRTTTLALNLLFIYNFAKGKREVKVFNRELHQYDIMKSLAITLLAIVMCAVSVIAISFSDSQQQLIAIFLEVCSAFGTVGLSMGITPELSVFAKCILMVLMFIGRIGLTSVFLIIGGEGNKDVNYRYPKERVITG
ncbi:TrkH family potassium uptake protein [Neobacillus notoginsengisoli]|uniref:TrkH family potassium uptake protein n=1 Tax=Neobacillus notoginsengisoli TaxID=1578198 RepID=A0A417YUZ8_9BACI|nr:TrkH family potassium uptake protein [Neobacillus notoginsengisoli]RHW41089.1 TrkH family potassium uptake protein [Neobacillus notoginsengisoli]